MTDEPKTDCCNDPDDCADYHSGRCKGGTVED